MSAQGTTDAVGAQAAPGSPPVSVRDLLAAGAAANAICTPPPEPPPAEPDGDAEPSLFRVGPAGASGV